MTAAVYRWFLSLSGASLIAYTCVAAFVLVSLVALGVEIADGFRKRFGTWHDRVTLKHGPIRYDQRDQGAGIGPWIATASVVWLVGLLVWKCGGVR